MPGEGRDLVLDDRIPKRLRSQGSNKDVFALVKATMSDDHLVQPPILVFPQAFLPATEGFFNRINSTSLLLSASLDEGRVEELLHLAQNMEVDFPHLKRGASYLRSLCDPGRRREPCVPLKFIQSGPSAFNNGLGNFQLGQRPLPPKPHKLKVVFHHR